MANYSCKTRTNYFSVTDEVKFRKIMASCWGSDEVIVFDENQDDGSAKYGFLCSGSIYGLADCDKSCDTCNPSVCEDEDIEHNYDAFCEALQDILPEGEAIVITESGSEAMRYLVGDCMVITRSGYKGICVKREAVKVAAAMLNNPGFTTKMDY